MGNLLLNGIVATYFSSEILMLVLCYLVTALASYCLGSINFAILISKIKYNDDIRKYGSGNAGMSNMLRTYGKGAAVMTFLGDAIKTAVSVFIGMLLVGSIHGGSYVAGFFAVLGHVFPCYYRFRGGKGVVAAAIAILMIDPRIFLMLIAIYLVVVLVWRYMSLGAVICAMCYPLLVYATDTVMYTETGVNNPVAIIFAFVIGLFVIIMHRENIKRLMTGKERKITVGNKKRKEDTEEQDQDK